MSAAVVSGSAPLPLWRVDPDVVIAGRSTAWLGATSGPCVIPSRASTGQYAPRRGKLKWTVVEPYRALKRRHDHATLTLDWMFRPHQRDTHIGEWKTRATACGRGRRWLDRSVPTTGESPLPTPSGRPRAAPPSREPAKLPREAGRQVDGDFRLGDLGSTRRHSHSCGATLRKPANPSSPPQSS